MPLASAHLAAAMIMQLFFWWRAGQLAVSEVCACLSVLLVVSDNSLPCWLQEARERLRTAAWASVGAAQSRIRQSAQESIEQARARIAAEDAAVLAQVTCFGSLAVSHQWHEW
jgi:hypothetical protein